MRKLEDKIERLWQWFAKKEKEIWQCVEDEIAPERDEITDSLNNLILDFGLFSWQIEEGKNRPYSLTISPNGDMDRLKISRQVIVAAPLLLDWEFHYAKQAKSWDPNLILFDRNMDEQILDISGWKYATRSKAAGKHELFFKIDDIVKLDDEFALAAAEQVTLNELGEETTIRNITSVKLIDKKQQEELTLTDIRQLAAIFG